MIGPIKILIAGRVEYLHDRSESDRSEDSVRSGRSMVRAYSLREMIRRILYALFLVIWQRDESNY